MAKSGSFEYDIKFNVNKQNLKDVQKSLSDIVNKATEFEKTAPDYAEPFREAGEAAKELKNILNSSWNSRLGQLDLTKVEKELVKTYGSLTNFRTSLELIGPEGSKAFNQLATAIFSTQTPLKQTSALLERMSTTFKNTIRYGISSSIFNNMTNSISKAYNYVQKLDKSLNDIRIVSQQSANQMERFAKQANEASRALGSTTLDYTNAALIYYQQGLSSEEVKNRVDVTLQLANVLKTTASDVSDYMTAIWNNFDKGTKSLEYYADVITALGAATASSSTEIAEGLNKFAAVSNTVGLSYEYATAALATVVAQTRQSADIVGTAFKTLFARIQDLELGEILDDGTTLGKYAEALEKVGINIKDQQGNLKEMNQILDEMGSKWQTLNKAQQVALAQNVAGTRQYTQLIALMDNWDKFQTNLNIALDSEGTLSEQQEIYMDSVEAHLNKLQTQWEQFYESIFDEDSIKSLADGLSTVIGIGNTFVTGLGGGMNTLVFGATTLGNVFSTQLAQSLLRVKNNAEKAKAALDTVTAQQKLYDEVYMQGIGADSVTVNNLEKFTQELDLDRRLLRVKESVNEQEQKNIALLDSEYRKNESLINAYEIIIQLQKEFKDQNSDEKLSSIGLQTLNYQKIQGRQNKANELSNFIKGIQEGENVESYFDILKEGVGKLSSSYQSLVDVETKLEAKEKELKKGKKELSAVDKAILQGNQELQKSYDRIFKAFNNYEQLKTEGKTFEDLDNDDQVELLNLVQKINSSYKEEADILLDVNKILENMSLQTLKHLPQEINGLEKKNEQIKETKEELVQQNELQQKITGELQTMFTLGSSVSAIFGAFKTLSNDDLSGWEKFGSIFTVIGTQGLMIMRTVDSLKANLPVLAVQLGICASEEEVITAMKEGQTAQLLLQITKQSILNTLKAIEAGIVATIKALTGNWLTLLLLAVGAIAGIIYAYKNWFSAEARLNAEIEKTNERLKEAREAYDDLKTTVSNYQDAYEGIQKLGQGTIDFYEAIVKANEAAQELIESLDLIAGVDYSVDNHGLITIKENVIEDALYKQMQDIYRSQANNYEAKGNYSQYQADKVVNNFRNAINKEAIRQGSTAIISKEQAEQILKNSEQTELNLGKLAQIIDPYNNPNANFYNTELAKNYNKLIDTQEDTAQQICDTIEESSIDIQALMGEYLPQYNAYINTTEAYKKQAALNDLRAYASQDQIKGINNLTVGSLDAISAILYNTKKQNSSDLTKNLPDWVSYDNWYDYINPWRWGTSLGANLSGTPKKLREQYAQNVLGYEYNEVTSGWINPKTGKDVTDEVKKINIQDAYNAYVSGEYSVLPEYEKTILPTINKAKEIADNKNLSVTSTNLITEALLRLQAGTMTDDFSKLLTNEEKQALDGSRSIYMRQTESGTQTTYGVSGVETQYSNQQLDEWLALSEEAGRSFERMQYDLQEYNTTLKTQAESLGTTTSALDLYAEAMYNAAGKVNDYTAETAAAAAQEYKFNKTYNKAVDTFEDNEEAFNKYVKSLKDGKKVSYDVADAAGEVIDSLKELGIVIRSKDLKDNNIVSNINKLLKGTEEEAEKAYKALYDLTRLNTLKSYFGDVDENTAAGRQRLQEYLDIIKDIDATEPGKTMSEKYAENLSNMIINTGMTVEQINDLASKLGIEIPVDYNVPKELSIEDKAFTTKATSVLHTYSGEMPNPGFGVFDKRQTIPVNYSWIETTEDKTDHFLVPKATNFTVNTNKTNIGGNNFIKATKSNSSGGSQSKELDPIKTDIDRYHKVNTQITKVDNSLSKLQSRQDKFMGSKLINNLNQQWDLLNIQISNYNEKLRIANEEQDELAKKLSAQGVQFNADRTIYNYAETIREQEAKVNNLIAQYNKLSDKQKEQWDKDKIIDNAKENFEQFKTNLDRYDELVSDFIPDLYQSIQDSVDKQVEINIKKFNMEIEIRLDMNQAIRDWNEWKKRAIDDIAEDNILGNSKARLQDFYTYFNSANGGDIQAATKKVLADLEQWNLLNQAGTANVFGIDRQSAFDTLNQDAESLRNSITQLIELQDELYQNVLDEMDHVQDKFDEQIKSYELLREVLNHDMKVIQLAYGDDSYDKLTRFYQANQDNYLKQLDFQRQQKDFWYEQMMAVEENSKEWDSAREKWEEALKEFNSILEESMENARKAFENTINDIFQKLNNKVTNNMGLDYVREEWDLINKNADQYLDSINAAAGVQALEQKYIEALNKSTRVQDQRKIAALMEEELNDLKQKDKLTQYDLDRAEKKYNLMLAQIALEDSQRNKNKMRLRRDTQGNYTYQYTADEDALNQAQNALTSSYNELYNFDKDRYKQVLNDIYSAWDEYQQKMAEAALINDPELRAEKELLIQEQYGELINELVRENEIIRTNLQESAFLDLSHLYEKELLNFTDLTLEERNLLLNELGGGFSDLLTLYGINTEEFKQLTLEQQNAIMNNVGGSIQQLTGFYNQDIIAFRNMAETERNLLVSVMVPAWTSSLQAMTDNFSGPNGFERNTIDAWNRIKNAEIQYDIELKNIENTANQTFDQISTGLDAAIDNTQDLIKNNDDLITSYEAELVAVQNVYKEVMNLKRAYDEAYQSALKAAELAHKARIEEQEANAQAAANQTITTNNSDGTPTISTPVETPVAVQPEPVVNTSPQGNGSVDKGDLVALNSDGLISSSSDKTPSLKTGYRGKQLYIQMVVNENKKAPYHLGTSPIYSSKTAVGWVNKKQISGYDTGGYTGDWENGGRLAFLHQKELVLNAEDTKNMLNAVSIIRSLAYSLGSSMLSRMAGVGAKSVLGSGSNGSPLEQNVHIQAEFPGVRDAKEIEEALNNLVNVAAQRVFENK